MPRPHPPGCDRPRVPDRDARGGWLALVGAPARLRPAGPALLTCGGLREDEAHLALALILHRVGGAVGQLAPPMLLDQPQPEVDPRRPPRRRQDVAAVYDPGVDDVRPLQGEVGPGA